MRDEIATYLNWTSNVAPLGENGQHHYVYKARCKINKLLMCRSWNQRFSTQDHFLLKAFLADTCAWLQWSFPYQFWERRFPYFRSLIFCLTASIFLPELSRTFYYSWEGITLPSSWLFARWFSSCSLDCCRAQRCSFCRYLVLLTKVTLSRL